MIEPNKYTKVIDSIVAGSYSTDRRGTGVDKRGWQWMRVLLHLGPRTPDNQATLRLQHSADNGATDTWVNVPGGPVYGPDLVGGSDGDKPREFSIYLPTTKWKRWLRPVVTHTGTGQVSYGVSITLINPQTTVAADQVPDWSNADTQAVSSVGIATGGSGGLGTGGAGDLGDGGTINQGGGGGGPPPPATFGLRGGIDWTGFSVGDVRSGGGSTPGGYDTITWTDFAQITPNGDPAHDDRTVYVSSSTGSDANAGTIGAPFQTIAQGYNSLRDGHADWLLLKCGDVFNENKVIFRRFGRSEAQRMLVSSYGSGPRPRIQTLVGNEAAFIPGWRSEDPVEVLAESNQSSNVAFVDLHFYGQNYDGTNAICGIQWQWSSANVLVEGCRFERLKTGIIAQLAGVEIPMGLRHQNFKVRGCIFVDQYCTVGGSSGSSTSQGIFAYGVDGLLMEFNVFDHNGWLDPAENPQAILTWVRHSGYISNGLTNVTLRDNLIMQSDGVMMRSGGVVHDNFNLALYGPFLYGQGIEPALDIGGVHGEITNNVTLDGRDIIDAGTLANVGGPLAMNIGNVSSIDISGNIWAHRVAGSGVTGIQISSMASHGYAGLTRTISGTYDNNIFYDWGATCIEFLTVAGDVQPHLAITNSVFDNARDNSPLISESAATSNANITSSGCHFYSQLVTSPVNRWFTVAGTAQQTLAQWMTAMTPDDTTSVAGRVTYVDAARDEKTYNATLGGAQTRAAFVASCRNQRRGPPGTTPVWDDRYTAPAINAYIREGFTPV